MKDFKAFFLIPASPEEVYAALTQAPTLQLWTGEPAIFEAVPDTEFSLWGDSIVGKNLEFEPGKKIVQQWYFGDENPDSVVTLKFHPHKKGTSVELQHKNIPEEAFEEITRGWKEVYFESLLNFYRE